MDKKVFSKSLVRVVWELQLLMLLTFRNIEKAVKLWGFRFDEWKGGVSKKFLMKKNILQERGCFKQVLVENILQDRGCFKQGFVEKYSSGKGPFQTSFCWKIFFRKGCSNKSFVQKLFFRKGCFKQVSLKKSILQLMILTVLLGVGCSEGRYLIVQPFHNLDIGCFPRDQQTVCQAREIS